MGIISAGIVLGKCPGRVVLGDVPGNVRGECPDTVPEWRKRYLVTLVRGP